MAVIELRSMGTYQISAAFQDDREGKALNATLQVVFVRERKQEKKQLLSMDFSPTCPGG